MPLKSTSHHGVTWHDADDPLTDRAVKVAWLPERDTQEGRRGGCGIMVFRDGKTWRIVIEGHATYESETETKAMSKAVLLGQLVDPAKSQGTRSRRLWFAGFRVPDDGVGPPAPSTESTAATGPRDLVDWYTVFDLESGGEAMIAWVPSNGKTMWEETGRCGLVVREIRGGFHLGVVNGHMSVSGKTREEAMDKAVQVAVRSCPLDSDGVVQADGWFALHDVPMPKMLRFGAMPTVRKLRAAALKP